MTPPSTQQTHLREPGNESETESELACKFKFNSDAQRLYLRVNATFKHKLKLLGYTLKSHSSETYELWLLNNETY